MPGDDAPAPDRIGSAPTGATEHRGALRGPALVAAAAQVFVDDLEALALSDDDAHHLTRSLRLRAGETVLAADGAGHWRRCLFRPPEAARPGAVASTDPRLEADGPVEFEPAPASPVTVGFVPVKGDRPEWVVQKLTEIGADRVIVLRSARSVVRWEGERGDRAVDRLRRVARLAAAQSRRAWLPTIDGAHGVRDLIDASAPGPLALADPRGEPLADGITAIAIGPEGGWDAGELAGPGVVAVRLGPTILRAETAAVSAATMLCALRDGSLRPW